MSLSSLVATLGYYPIGGEIMPHPGPAVSMPREKEEEKKPYMLVKKVTCEDSPSEINVAVVTIKTIR